MQMNVARWLVEVFRAKHGGVTNYSHPQLAGTTDQQWTLFGLDDVALSGTWFS